MLSLSFVWEWPSLTLSQVWCRITDRQHIYIDSNIDLKWPIRRQLICAVYTSCLEDILFIFLFIFHVHMYNSSQASVSFIHSGTCLQTSPCVQPSRVMSYPIGVISRKFSSIIQVSVSSQKSCLHLQICGKMVWLLVYSTWFILMNSCSRYNVVMYSEYRLILGKIIVFLSM